MKIKQHTLEFPISQKRNHKNKKKKWEMSETNENENTRYQNAGDATKAVVKGKLTAVNTYIKIKEKSQINDRT